MCGSLEETLLPSDEGYFPVTLMFIRYCPDPELALIFKSKPLEEWTAAEVQVRPDECQREQRLRQHQLRQCWSCNVTCQAHRNAQHPRRNVLSPYCSMSWSRSQLMSRRVDSSRGDRQRGPSEICGGANSTAQLITVITCVPSTMRLATRLQYAQ